MNYTLQWRQLVQHSLVAKKKNEHDHSWFDFAMLHGSQAAVQRQRIIQLVNVSPRR